MSSDTVLPSVTATATSSSYWTTIAKAAGGLLLTIITAVARALLAGILRAFAYLSTATIWLLTSTYAVAFWPLARITEFLRFLLSPVTYTLSYTFAPLFAFFNFLGRLRPLYTYLGSAAFIGIVTGLVLKFASSYIVVIFSLDSECHEVPNATNKQSSEAPRLAGPTRTALSGSASSASAPSVSAPSVQKVAIKSEKPAGAQDNVWQWLEEYNPKQPAVTIDNGSMSNINLLQNQIQQHRPGALLSHTIMEESSSE